MDIRTAKQVHRPLEEVQEEPLASLYDNLLEAAVRYARIRVDWEMASREERRKMDQERTAAHGSSTHATS